MYHFTLKHVTIYQFFCIFDFTWNQFWLILEGQNYHFDNFWSSEFWFLGISDLKMSQMSTNPKFRAGKMVKMGLQSDQNWSAEKSWNFHTVYFDVAFTKFLKEKCKNNFLQFSLSISTKFGMEILLIYFHSDFTWNQIWLSFNLKNYQFDHFENSWFWNFQKIHIQTL